MQTATKRDTVATVALAHALGRALGTPGLTDVLHDLALRLREALRLLGFDVAPTALRDAPEWPEDEPIPYRVENPITEFAQPLDPFEPQESDRIPPLKGTPHHV